MRYRKLATAAVAAAAVFGASFLMFQPPPRGWVCPDSGISRDCLYPGDPARLGAIDVASPDSGVASWQYLGRVCAACSWPFRRGSGWNIRYNNQPAYQIKLSYGRSCVYITRGTSQVRTGTCSPGAQASVWVRSGWWLVSVYATSAYTASSRWRPRILTARCLQVRCAALEAPGGSWSAAKQRWGVAGLAFG